VKARNVIAVEKRRDSHVHLQLRGFGMPGSRPLLGEISCSPDEAAFILALFKAAGQIYRLATEHGDFGYDSPDEARAAAEEHHDA